jgi:hypothetical protein
MAYNQAGFVPFMLGARNIDDLGICTKFYAKLPTTDVVFTEVGRYSPLTPRPVLRAGDAYTLTRAPRLLLAPVGNIRSANGGRVPETVLGGGYHLLFSTSAVAAYGPTDSTSAVCNPCRYLENLVHISYLKRAVVGDRMLDASEYRTALPFLYSRPARVTFDDRYAAEFVFGSADEDVYELHIGSIRSASDAQVVMTLFDTARRAVFRERLALTARQERDLHLDLGSGLKAASLAISIVPDTPGSQAVDLDDVRVQGQSAALKRFLLDYPAVR